MCSPRLYHRLTEWKFWGVRHKNKFSKWFWCNVLWVVFLERTWISDFTSRAVTKPNSFYNFSATMANELFNFSEPLWFLKWKWVPWTARGSNQSILKEINLEYRVERLMLKLKLHYSGHLMHTADSLEKTLILGKTEGRRKRGQESMRWLDSITDSMDMSLSQFWEIVKDREACPSDVLQAMGVTKSATKQQKQIWEQLFCSVVRLTDTIFKRICSGRRGWDKIERVAMTDIPPCIK